jgi:HPr kinase/phosphorylase
LVSSATGPSITAGALLGDPSLALPLTLLAGAQGLGRPIGHARIQKPGLALAGHAHGVVATRVQILGETEISYLASLAPEARRRSVDFFFSLGFSLVILTAGDAAASADLVAAAELAGVPLARSPARSSHTITALHVALDERLAPRTVIHGVLVDVFGQGLLLLGKSGIGKSECALELVMRGHRLVADDSVHCDWQPPGSVFGAPAALLAHHIEVRGLGVLNVRNLFGVTATRDRKRIDLVIRLLEWSEDTEYDRMGVEDRFHEVLGVAIREIVLPVRPGRSMASILEVAARNELTRASGVHSAREFFGRLNQTLLNLSPEEADRLVPPTPPTSPVPPLVAPITSTPPPPAVAAGHREPGGSHGEHGGHGGAREGSE